MSDFTDKPAPGVFEHRHAAHCESGVMSSLLRYHGQEISEPMAFGLAAALAFVYLPFVKVGGFPLFAYRMPPGAIIRGLRKRLGLRMQVHRYRNPEAAMADLDRHLAEGRIVGLQTSAYWLPYFPPDMRFHFNAHNLIVFGKTADGEYRISDPVFEEPVTCPAADLKKARFVKGTFAPKGLLYYPAAVPQEVDIGRGIDKAVRKVANRMLKAPVPYIGVRGIRTLARRLRTMGADGTDPRYARLFVAQIVRMQEEIGTGGGGFRFMYASFLQEASQRFGRERLAAAADAMTGTGDTWRQFALAGAHFCRDKRGGGLEGLSDLLLACAEHEEATYRLMLK